MYIYPARRHRPCSIAPATLPVSRRTGLEATSLRVEATSLRDTFPQVVTQAACTHTHTHTHTSHLRTHALLSLPSSSWNYGRAGSCESLQGFGSASSYQSKV